MVLQQLGDFSEVERLAFLGECWVLEGIGLVARVLVLGKNVTPQLLILAHELEHGLPIALLFVVDVDVRNLFGLESAKSICFLGFFASACE